MQAEQEQPILEVEGQSEWEGKFNITQSEASICFAATDTLSKSVSMDFVRTDDPLRGLIPEKDKLATH